MAVIYPHYQLAKILESHQIILNCRDVNEMLANLSEMATGYANTGLNTVSITVNGISINQLEGTKTRLKEDDQVYLLVPSAGG